MIVDSSVLVAILAREVESDRFSEIIVDAGEVFVAAPSVLETTIVLSRYGRELQAKLAHFLAAARITIVTFDSDQLASAQAAYLRFGRGSGHRAGLNFGDCMSYAAASVLRRPLLFKGDFTHTDIESVRWRPESRSRLVTRASRVRFRTP
jgi:ribonuclease VapC